MKKGFYFAAILTTALLLMTWTMAGQKTQLHPAWEYKSINIPDYEGLARVNEAGSQGWELVAVTPLEGVNKMYIFKRAK
jgi:hypothetical protein